MHTRLGGWGLPLYVVLLNTTLAFVPSSCVLAAEGIVKKCNTVKKKKKSISVKDILLQEYSYQRES